MRGRRLGCVSVQVAQFYAALVAFHVVSTQLLFSLLKEMAQFLTLSLRVLYKYIMRILRGVLAAMADGEVAQHATMGPADFQVIAAAVAASFPAIAAGRTCFRTSDDQASGAVASL